MVEQDSESEGTRLQRIWQAFSVAVILIVLFFALVIIKPALPDRVVLLTGPEGSAYHEFGVRLAGDLNSRGIDTEVIMTGGALDNLQRLGDEDNVVALAPSIVDWQGKFGDSSELVALGSVGLEPFWLFCRSELEVVQVADLAGRKLATEGAGTTSHQFANLLIDQLALPIEWR